MTEPKIDRILEWVNCAVMQADRSTQFPIYKNWGDTFSKELAKIAYAAGRKAGMEEARLVIMVDFPDGIESMSPEDAHILACGLGSEAIRAAMEYDYARDQQGV